MSDLSSLFPDLPADILRDFDDATSSWQREAPLSVGGEQSQVTDEQVEAYLRSVGSLRAPLPPAISGQPTPPAPQFLAGQGRPAPSPDASYVEAADMGDGVATLPPAAPPPPSPTLPSPPSPHPPQPPRATETTPLPPPPVPPHAEETQAAPPATPPPSPTLGDQVVPSPPPPASRAEAMESLVQLWDSDPQLRNIVASYLTTGQTPASGSYGTGNAAPPVGASPQAVQAPPTVPSAGAPQYAPDPRYQSLAPPPQLDEYTDPHIRSLYEQNAVLNQRIEALSRVQAQNEEQLNQSQLRHYESLVEGVVSQFGSQYSLPPDVLQSVRETAARLGAANSYMNGVHPITGLPVRPDPAEAVRTALSIAYYSTPSARDLEQQRILQRSQSDAQHRQRLSGVGGSAASVPRTPPAPTTPSDRNAAMKQEVAEMFNGSWTGGNTN